MTDKQLKNKIREIVYHEQDVDKLFVLIQQARQEGIEELKKKVEGMKLNLPKDKTLPLASAIIESHEISYNLAISDIIKLLEE
jgi:hypothetical protein